jgi:hypothetical protein
MVTWPGARDKKCEPAFGRDVRGGGALRHGWTETSTRLASRTRATHSPEEPGRVDGVGWRPVGDDKHPGLSREPSGVGVDPVSADEHPELS